MALSSQRFKLYCGKHIAVLLQNQPTG